MPEKFDTPRKPTTERGELPHVRVSNAIRPEDLEAFCDVRSSKR